MLIRPECPNVKVPESEGESDDTGTDVIEPSACSTPTLPEASGKPY